MTDRVSKELDRLLIRAWKHKCYGRRFKRQVRRMLRMNAWDIKNQQAQGREENIN